MNADDLARDLLGIGRRSLDGLVGITAEDRRLAAELLPDMVRVQAAALAEGEDAPRVQLLRAHLEAQRVLLTSAAVRALATTATTIADELRRVALAALRGVL